jgi:hypothetical protein
MSSSTLKKENDCIKVFQRSKATAEKGRIEVKKRRLVIVNILAKFWFLAGIFQTPNNSAIMG